MKKLIALSVLLASLTGCATTEDPRPFPRLMAALGYQDYWGNVYEEYYFDPESGELVKVRSLYNDRNFLALFLDTLGLPIKEAGGC